MPDRQPASWTRALRVSSCVAFAAFVIGTLILPALSLNYLSDWHLIPLAFVPLGIVVFQVRDTAKSYSIMSILLCAAEGVYVQTGLMLITGLAVLPIYWLEVPGFALLGICIILSAVGAGLWFSRRSAYDWPFAAGLFALSIVWSRFALRPQHSQMDWDWWNVILMLSYVAVGAGMVSLYRSRQSRRSARLPQQYDEASVGQGG